MGCSAKENKKEVYTNMSLFLWCGMGMSVCCECCVLSGRGLCDELITRPEESYQLWCVVVRDLIKKS